MIIKDYHSLNAKIAVDFVKTDLEYASSGSSTDEIIESILGDIKSFNITSSIRGTMQEPEISLKSDIDEKLKKGLRAQANKEVKKYKAKLKVAVSKEFTKQLGDIDLGEFNDVQKILDSNTKDSNALENILKKHISKEAMQKQLQSKGVDKLKSKLKNKLKFW